jgi:hypothetical protein
MLGRRLFLLAAPKYQHQVCDGKGPNQCTAPQQNQTNGRNPTLKRTDILVIPDCQTSQLIGTGYFLNLFPAVFGTKG